MPRTYTVPFEQVLVAAAQDLIQVKGAAGKMLRIVSVSVGATDSAVPSAQMLALRCRYLPVTVTDGSGGTSVTPRPADPGDAAASFTALANNTVKATTNGTAAILDEAGVHISAGYDYQFPRPPYVGPTGSFVFELLSTVAGTVHLSGKVKVEEAG